MPVAIINDDETVYQLAMADGVIDHMLETAETLDPPHIVTAIISDISTKIYQYYFGYKDEKDNGWVLAVIANETEQRTEEIVNGFIDMAYDGNPEFAPFIRRRQNERTM